MRKIKNSFKFPHFCDNNNNKKFNTIFEKRKIYVDTIV